MPTSEEYTKQRALLVHSPAYISKLKSLKGEDAVAHNFNSLPDWRGVLTEFLHLVAEVKKHGIKVIELADLLDQSELDRLNQDPNSLFTRDPVITLPWLPRSAIVSRMRLTSRQSEPAIFKAALEKLGFKHFFEAPDDVWLEGGDVMAKIQNGKRVLYVGNGDRTNEEAILWLAETLIKAGHLDEIICFKHNRAMLHLDTCFSILPNRTVLCARDTYRDGFIIGADMHLKPIEPLEYLKSQNYHLIYIPQAQAERDEGCNLLYIGANDYLSFKMPSQLAAALQAASDIKLHQIDGSEIAKANGGAHCLTLPIYI